MKKICKIFVFFKLHFHNDERQCEEKKTKKTCVPNFKFHSLHSKGFFYQSMNNNTFFYKYFMGIFFPKSFDCFDQSEVELSNLDQN